MQGEQGGENLFPRQISGGSQHDDIQSVFMFIFAFAHNRILLDLETLVWRLV
jgi:hypothetical protein